MKAFLIFAIGLALIVVGYYIYKSYTKEHKLAILVSRILQVGFIVLLANFVMTVWATELVCKICYCALLAAGAQRDPQSNSGWTPLIVAAINGHTEIVKSLLAAGANINAKDEDDWTPLMQAAHNGHTETVKLLLKAGATGAADAAKVCTDPAVLQLLQTPQ